ncbi:MAG TPA: histidine kinase dimerization/phospho-acceptor domain-containing protein [Geminicoccaceae bacterium]|nr:histidine kinase dimerization/phospho-acceptor domain-containing protein [Geminicoccaceae bacterium]
MAAMERAAAGATAFSYDEIEHELRTPLAAIRSLSEILHDTPELPECQRRRFLAAMVAESERLTRTVEHLLARLAPGAASG